MHTFMAILSLVLVIISLQQINVVNSIGCRQTPEIEVISNKIYGCSSEPSGGSWQSNCNYKNYHICENAQEVSILGLKKNDCRNISRNNEIFLTFEYTTGSKCPSYPNDNTNAAEDDVLRIWGCSSAITDPNIENNPCGPLTSDIDYFKHKDDKELTAALCCIDAPSTGCLPWIGHIHEEIIPNELYMCPQSTQCGAEYFPCKNTNQSLNDAAAANSGVLCCPRGTGCLAKESETPIIEKKIYACPGNYADEFTADRFACAPKYHVCNSARELKYLHFTNDDCANVGNNGEFYATLEGITENIYYKNKCNTSINGIWGCSSTEPTDDTCSPLNSVIRDGILSDADGVLCCTDGEWIDTAWNNMPYMVSLRNGDGDHSCGGSILTLDGHNEKGGILTAAHCDGLQQVYVGCTTTLCSDKYKDSLRNYSIELWVNHPKWDPDSSDDHYDIAIIYLTEPITHPGAIPVVIESDPMIAENNGVIKLTGYYGSRGASQLKGAPLRGGSDTDSLEYGLSNIMAREECKEWIIKDENLTFASDVQHVVTSNNFCIRDDDATNGLISWCGGDSGSPLIYEGKQLGIVSFGSGACDPFDPRVATYVPSFYQWIISECGADCIVNDGYLGCYTDKQDNPALTKEIISEDKNNDKIENKNKFGGMTNKIKKFSIDKCKKECNGYKYFALQNDGRKCFCENKYESATSYNISHDCGLSKLGGVSSNSLFVHSGFQQKQYLPDNVLSNGINLRYGPGNGVNGDVIYTVESCRISCSQFKYFSVSKDGECKCDNEYIKSYDESEYNRYGLFKNVLKDGIEVNVNCDNFLNDILFKNHEYNEYISLPLMSGESYPYDDWTKTQTVMLPNSANCGKVRIVCANAANDDGPAGVMIGIKYNKQHISSNKETIQNGIIKSTNNNQIVLSSQSSTTPLSDKPYNAKWIWTCGDNGQWEKCGVGLENTFEIDLCKLSVADTPNIIDLFIPKDKTVIYLFLSIMLVVFNVGLVYVFCFKSSKKYTKVKRVQFDEESDVENEKV